MKQNIIQKFIENNIVYIFVSSLVTILLGFKCDVAVEWITNRGLCKDVWWFNFNWMEEALYKCTTFFTLLQKLKFL